MTQCLNSINYFNRQIANDMVNKINKENLAFNQDFYNYFTNVTSNVLILIKTKTTQHEK
jgi:hypothetical protein